MQVAPDFSVRLLDESYTDENTQIGKIQDLMVDYFKTRTSNLAQGGLNALRYLRLCLDRLFLPIGLELKACL